MVIVRECNESDVRLVGGQTVNDGRVEICVWGTVCDDRWDIHDATVVCSNMMDVSSSFVYNSIINKYVVFMLKHFLASYPLLSYDGTLDFFKPIHLDNVQCNGTESMLIECSHQGTGNHNCVYGSKEAGVICTGLFNYKLL